MDPQPAQNTINEESDLLDFYSEQTVLVTGGSGFLGKMLIEALLRKTNVNRIYIILRSKKNIPSEERLRNLLKNDVYNVLKDTAPQRLAAVSCISGDLEKPDLGLSETDKEKLIKQTNIVFHSGASVNMNRDLKSMVEINVNGTHFLMNLAREMKNLKVVMHISTAFSNNFSKEIGERIYPLTDGINLTQLAYTLDEKTSRDINKMITQEHINNYAYTKRAAESIIQNTHSDLPVAILRPAVVCGSYREPLPGWVDNQNGAVAVSMGIMLGLTHVFFFMDTDAASEIVPVDVVINCLIAAAWDAHLRYSTKQMVQNIPVYNVVASSNSKITWKKFINVLEINGQKKPSKNTVWLPFVFSASSWILFRLLHLILHYIPAFIADKIQLLQGKTPKFMKIIQKLDRVTITICPFTKKYSFEVENVKSLWKKMNSKERALFPFYMEKTDWEKYYEVPFYEGIRKFVINDDITNSERKDKANRILLYHYSVLGVLITCLFGTIHFVISRLLSSH